MQPGDILVYSWATGYRTKPTRPELETSQNWWCSCWSGDLLVAKSTVALQEA
jgi:hypothetical protein